MRTVQQVVNHLEAVDYFGIVCTTEPDATVPESVTFHSTCLHARLSGRETGYDRDREIETKRQRDKDREIGRQRDRETKTERQRQRDRDRETKTETWRQR